MNPPGGVVRLRLSSTLAVDAGDGARSGRELGSRKARTLLALLAASRGRPVATDRIVAALWPEAPPADPAANVATLVSRVRRTLGAGLVEGRPGAYSLGGSWSIDLVEAEQWVAEAAGRLAAGEHALAESAAAAALELLGGETALLDEVDDDWVLQVRRDVDALRRAARHHRVAALLALDPATAVRVATEGTGADVYDELAVRDLMRALAADGRAAAALSAYDRLARTLREDLGTDPDRATSDLHLALLRETPVDGDAPTSRPRPRREESQVLLVGREEEVTLFREAWGAVVATAEADLVLVVGEGGIGKTRLLDTVADLGLATGGQVLRGRCHPAERSLFLQPFVDALRPALAGLQRDHLAATLRDHEAAWVSLVPDLAAVLPNAPAPPADRDLQRRATYDAVAAALRRLSAARPLVLVLDDLQDAGAATVDLLGYLARQLGTSRVLLVGAVRTEDLTVAERLGDRATRIHLGPLGPEAVATLAADGRPRAARWPGHGAHRRPHPQRGRVPPRAPQRRHRRPCLAVAGPAGPRRPAGPREPIRRGGRRRAAPAPRPAPPGRAGRGVRGRRDAPRRGAHPRRAVRAQRCGLRVRQRPVPGVRVRRPAGGRGRGLPPAGRRPDQRPARGDGHPRARRRRRRPCCPGLVARR